MPRVHKAVEERTFAVTLGWPLGWRLAGDMEELHTQYQAVRRENQELRKAVGFLGSTCDYLENQSRRNNLLFFGFAAVPAGTEPWDVCEGGHQARYVDNGGQPWLQTSFHINRDDSPYLSPEIECLRNIQQNTCERRFLRNIAKKTERTDVIAAGDETEGTAIQATI